MKWVRKLLDAHNHTHKTQNIRNATHYTLRRRQRKVAILCVFMKEYQLF